ncbi:MAG: hypothetical protein WAU12_12985 [Saprospiraceae bacterium]|jgi:hypothetical protein|uniref:hypothetical protein n=1 Tax=Candidatus Brachybacter algidus TaxID=2982024 RepID=UPI001B5B165C|nr:hypothetical protein [Candidatus Brachybacter algidus]MBK6448943.1 hypothetical protein [Candidatus Brachybacter algidus]MBK8746403.1 hypothetical protein [Candidatus Brachybacter algidus]MBP8894278.1 hypothetical protein [Saprospiraceae bacterium]MBP9847568.1 hypothetical protein [Saprospiraceae bacterium]
MLSKTLKIYLTIFACLFILSSFNHSVPPAETRQVIRVNYADDPDGIKAFSYDEECNVIMFVQSKDTTIYTYSPRKISKRYLNNKEHWDRGIDFELDKFGRIASANVLGNGDTIISTSNYTYNDEGYLTKSKREVIQSKNITITEYEYKDGNMVLRKESNGEGQIQYNFFCDYYLDKNLDLNLFVQSFSDEILSKNRFGKMSRNLVKTSCNISMEGDTMSHLSYNYGDLTDKKSMKMVEKDVNNDFETEITYHFK